MFPKPLLLVDVETTGLSPRDDAIIEIAACVLSADALQEEKCFHSRVATDRRISTSAFRIHGITDRDLLSEPSLAAVIARFDSFAPRDVVLCGHNVAFDAAFLREAYSRTGNHYLFDYHLLDIWSAAFFVLGARSVRLPSYNLNTLCSVLGIERAPNHNALQDVRASAAILRQLVSAVRGSDMEVLGQFTFFR